MDLKILITAGYCTKSWQVGIMNYAPSPMFTKVLRIVLCTVKSYICNFCNHVLVGIDTLQTKTKTMLVDISTASVYIFILNKSLLYVYNGRVFGFRVTNNTKTPITMNTCIPHFVAYS